ncbi:hypothetical protein [Castellaniella sp.]|uniref:hypothetical protein n=1 Tax=Castellaniella sp. TaxID=1955812 RepID=UPI003A5988C1
MDGLGVLYQEIDLSKDAHVERLRHRAAPVVEIPPDVSWSCFHPDLIARIK